MLEKNPRAPRKPRIAIAGATGRVGSTLTTLLAADPVEVVALTRRPDAAGLPQGVAVAPVDFDHPETLQAALRGVDRLFISHGTSPQQAINEIALIDAAVATGVDHIVKLSSMGPPTRLYPMAWHMEIEAHLARQSVASTVLRPSAFLDILVRWPGAGVASGTWIGAAGDGRVNFIDTRDVAKAARVALLADVQPDSQRVYHLTGPRVWTIRQIAEELSRLLGHPVVYVDRPLEEERAALLAAGLAPFMANLVAGLEQMFRDSALGETTSTVEELTGEPPRTLPQWLAENIAVFRT